MIGIAKRVTVQTLSQILFFALCAPPTGSIPQGQSRRPTPAVRGVFLPKKENYVTQSSEFEPMKKALAPVSAKSEKEQKDKPSLLMPEKDCSEPQKTDYKPGEAIDKICARKAF